MSAWTCRCQSADKAAAKIVPLRSRTPCWKGLGADSEEKREPVSDVDTAMVNSLTVLDPKWPIREDRMSAWTYRCQSAGKTAQKIVPLRARTPCWKGLGADSEEKREPVSDVDTVMVDSLKVLDPEWPIREDCSTSFSTPILEV